MLFDLQLQVCESYGVSPFEIRKIRFGEFCLFFDRLNIKGNRNLTKDGLIRRKCNNDSWF